MQLKLNTMRRLKPLLFLTILKISAMDNQEEEPGCLTIFMSCLIAMSGAGAIPTYGIITDSNNSTNQANEL
jgi:hypothetical protein